MTVPITGAVVMTLRYRVQTFRFLGPQQLQFEIPRVGPAGNPNVVPPGTYNVEFTYVGLWIAPGDQPLVIV